ncbi:MAG: hypothetical protein JST00_37425 [Deltaproteobacteria bacterium]|nr:hypothetical protein [Deltaproteobacteria bacterium]
MARTSRWLMIGAIAATAGCSLVFGFDDLLPSPATAGDGGALDVAMDTPVGEPGSDAACPPGFDDCDDKPGCETLISGSDRNNCGACGRKCGTADCNSGACSPEIIAVDDVLTIAADSTGVYWTTPAIADADAGADADPAGRIVRSTPDGGDRKVLAIASLQSGTGTIALDGTHVYWATSDDKIRRVPKGGGAVETFSTAASAGTIQRLAVFGDTAFVTVRSQPNSGRVDAIPLGNGPAISIAQNQENPASIVAGPQYVHWAIPDTDEAVRQVQSDGGMPAKFFSYGGSVQYLATDGARLYWTHAKAGDGVFAADIPLSAGGKVDSLFKADGAVGRGIAVDATHVYWAADTSIERVRKDGTKHVTLARLSGGAAREIAIDDTFVYFVIGVSGSTGIARTPK